MKGFILGVVVAVLLGAGIPYLVIVSGHIDVTADGGPNLIEKTFAHKAMDRAVEVHAGDAKNPLAGNPEAVREGFEHFKETCVTCHGAPGVKRSEFAQGLEPRPPELSHSLDDMSPAALFWVTKHGIKMTAMPAFGETHNDQQIWQMVTFIQHLPHLTPEEKAELQAATAEHHEHGGEEGDEAPADTTGMN